MLLLKIALSPALAANPELPPAPLTRDDPQLLVSGAPGHETVWFESAGVALRLDPGDGHILDRQPIPTDALGAYTVRLGSNAPRTVTVGFATGSFELPRVQAWALASQAADSDLLLAAADKLIRVHPSGIQEAISAPGIQHVAGLPEGIAYAHGRDAASGRVAGLVVHSAGSACFLDGPNAPIVAPLRTGDLLIVRERDQTLLVTSDCAVLATLPIQARAATLTPEALWLLTDKALLRYARHGDELAAPTSVTIAGRTTAAPCPPDSSAPGTGGPAGADPCLAFGPLVWNPFTGQRAVGDVEPAPQRSGQPRPLRRDLSPFTLVGAEGDGPFRLRAVASGTRVVNTSTGHDVGVEIPRWARQGVVSADGRLAMIVDDQPTPRTALFEVATGKELWSFPALSSPVLLTARGAVLNQPDHYLLDTATGRSVLKLVRGDSGREGWIDGALLAAPADWWTTETQAEAVVVAALHGAAGEAPPLAPRGPAVVAPEPADAGLADDPLARSLAWRETDRRGAKARAPVPLTGLPHLLAAEEARTRRIRALAASLNGAGAPPDVANPPDAPENPLDVLRGDSVWPAASIKAVDVAATRRSLPPTRSVAGVTGVTLHNNPVTLPLRPDRSVLVVIGTDGQLPERLLSAARDPAIDVLWATGDDGAIARLIDEAGGGAVLPGLVGMLQEHDPAQTIEVGSFAGELADHLGLPEPGAMLVNAEGRVLAEGDIGTVSDAMRWRNLDGVRVPKPTAAEWRYEGPEPVRSLAALTVAGVAFRTDRTVGMVRGDGTLGWDVTLISKQIDVAGDLVLVSDGRTVIALGVDDGRERWRTDGMVVATGATFALITERATSRVVSLSDGEPVSYPRPLVNPSGNGDTLLFDGPEDWRCGVNLAGAPVPCTEGSRAGAAILSWDAPKLTAVDDDGRELWTATVAGQRIQGSYVLACLGSVSGPWVELDARGKPSVVLLTDTPPETNPSPTGKRRWFGTDRGAIVAWRAK